MATPQQFYDGLHVAPNSGPEHAPEPGFPPNYPIPSDREDKADGMEVVGAWPFGDSGGGKVAVGGDGRKGTICGMRRRTFWIVAAIAAIVVVAAVIGGAVGATRKSTPSSTDIGSTASDAGASNQSTSASSTPTSTPTSTGASSPTSTKPSATGLARNCTSSTNGTTYFSYFLKPELGSYPGSALTFKRLCDAQTVGGTNLAQVKLPAFEQCIELCASWNYWQSSIECQAADYRNTDAYCWILKGTSSTEADSSNTDVAIFDSSAKTQKPTIEDPNNFPNPISDCKENNTYTSRFTDGQDGLPSSGAGLKFEMKCNKDVDPAGDSQNLAQVYLPSFDQCMELCASINFWSNSKKCVGARYNRVNSRCWIKGKIDGFIYNSDGEMAILA